MAKEKQFKISGMEVTIDRKEIWPEDDYDFEKDWKTDYTFEVKYDFEMAAPDSGREAQLVNRMIKIGWGIDAWFFDFIMIYGGGKNPDDYRGEMVFRILDYENWGYHNGKLTCTVKTTRNSSTDLFAGFEDSEIKFALLVLGRIHLLKAEGNYPPANELLRKLFFDFVRDGMHTKVVEDKAGKFNLVDSETGKVLVNWNEFAY